MTVDWSCILAPAWGRSCPFRAGRGAFFKTANEEDEFFRVAFNDLPRLATAVDTQDCGDSKPSCNGTALFDAAVRALQEIKKSKPHRKTLLIIPDGGDNSSCFAETEFHSRIWLRRATY